MLAIGVFLLVMTAALALWNEYRMYIIGFVLIGALLGFIVEYWATIATIIGIALIILVWVGVIAFFSASTKVPDAEEIKPGKAPRVVKESSRNSPANRKLVKALHELGFNDSQILNISREVLKKADSNVADSEVARKVGITENLVSGIRNSGVVDKDGQRKYRLGELPESRINSLAARKSERPGRTPAILITIGHAVWGLLVFTAVAFGSVEIFPREGHEYFLVRATEVPTSQVLYDSRRPGEEVYSVELASGLIGAFTLDQEAEYLEVQLVDENRKVAATGFVRSAEVDFGPYFGYVTATAVLVALNLLGIVGAQFYLRGMNRRISFLLLTLGMLASCYGLPFFIWLIFAERSARASSSNA